MGRINIANIEANANAVASLWNTRYSIISEVINGNIDAENLATDAVETAKIKDNAVTTAKILDGNITADKLAEDAITTATISDGSITLEKLSDSLKNAIYPIGAIFTSFVATNPATLIGFGTWTAFGAGRVIVGKDTSGTFATAGALGGSEDVTLTAAQSGLVGHNHSQNAHGHSENAHTHTQNSHNHSQNAHQHGYSSTNNPVLGPALNEWGASYNFGQYKVTDATTATNNATTATNQYTTATINANTATNNAVAAANAVSAHSNLQPYVVAYYWRRTA